MPFIARLVENAIREVDSGLIEAARAMGATPLQIELTLIRMASHEPKNTSAAHMEAFYRTFEDARADWRGKLASVEITWTGPWSMQGVVAANN